MKWESVEIGQLGEVITGNTPPRKNPELYGDFIPFIKPTDMEIDRRYTPNPEESYSELGFEKYQKSLIPKGSTCVVTIGSIGKKMTQAFTDCFINQAVNAVIPNENFDKDFIFYLLRNNLDKVKGSDSGTSSGRENVSKSAFSSIQVKVNKHLPTQRKIASILSAYDDLIENNLKRIKLLEEKAEIVYKTEFDFFKPSNEINKLPIGWKVQRADEIFRINIGKTPPREQQEWFNDIDSGVKWVSIKDINNSTVFLLNTSETVTENAVNKFNMNVAKSDTVILSFKLTVGKVAITTEEMVTNEAIAHFNIDDETKMNFEFIYFYLKNFPYDSLGSTSSIGTAINSKIVKAMPVLLPTEKVIGDFGKNVKPTFKLIKTLLKQNAKLREARDILLPRLMNGEIEV
jgi:type I restriction enzyme S subunit